MAKVVHIQVARQKRDQAQSFNQWVMYYQKQAHEELLEALVHEHDHNFPLRSSAAISDQMRHQALLSVIDDRAQTSMLKSFIQELRQ